MIIYTLLFWWIRFLFFQRVFNTYPKRNSWKKAITVTFAQSLTILIFLPSFITLSAELILQSVVKRTKKQGKLLPCFFLLCY
ncbi:hypothetical protein F7732_04585 [Bacillus mesophilum]|uniref:Uncharacterized protein n=1 Tax=Bacillus mesophilum TaxID=1071718 RepID=A0A7V7RSA2_9BACI|nr:hypothetical protein F7732_04585 [Bacillus mesophilum]